MQTVNNGFSDVCHRASPFLLCCFAGWANRKKNLGCLLLVAGCSASRLFYSVRRTTRLRHAPNYGLPYFGSGGRWSCAQGQGLGLMEGYPTVERLGVPYFTHAVGIRLTEIMPDLTYCPVRDAFV